MQNKNSKKMLIIVCTHGDEQIGINAIKLLKKRRVPLFFDVKIGNPLALKKK